MREKYLINKKTQKRTINSWHSIKKGLKLIHLVAGLFLLLSLSWLSNCSEKRETKGSAIKSFESRAESQVESGFHEHQESLTQVPSAAKQKPGIEKEKEGKTLYHCPMHPNYISEKPGECPICGMTLVPIEEEKESAEARPAGTVEISPEKQQILGVTFGRVETRPLHRVFSAYGRISYDETRLATISIKFPGWVEALYADYTGKPVRKGQPLFSIYSPELIAAQEEYLLALRAQKTMIEDQKINNLSIVEAAKRRLLLWDISGEQIADLEKEGKPFRALTIYSPVTGYIIEKYIVQGKYVTAGEVLYSIADLSHVWMLAEIYESDLPFISVGTEVTLELSSFPGEKFKGKISYIFPYLENETRTVKVRIELFNQALRLKPEMYGRVVFHLPLGQRLSLPEEAVIDTGERKIVFVVHENRHFEPREVKLGLKADDYYEVLAGVKEGEQVVTSAQFLIDSESRLKAALKGLSQAKERKMPEAKKTPVEEKKETPIKHIH